MKCFGIVLLLLLVLQHAENSSAFFIIMGVNGRKSAQFGEKQSSEGETGKLCTVDFGAALEALQAAKRQRQSLSVTDYSVAINACCNAREWDWTLLLTEEMKQVGLVPDPLSLKSAVLAACHIKDRKLAERLLSSFNETGHLFGLEVYDAVLHLVFKEGDYAAVLCYMEEMLQTGVVPSLNSYTSAIASCNKLNQPETALQWYADASRKGVMMDAIASFAVLDSCKLAGRWSFALRVLAQMQKQGIPLDAAAYSKTIAVCSRCKQYSKVLELFVRMKKTGIEPEAFTYTTVMTALKNQGELTKLNTVMGLFFKDCKHITVKDISFIVNMCRRSNLVNPLVFALKQSIKQGISPSSEIWKDALLTMKNTKEWEKAVAIIQLMKERKVLISIKDYTLALRACAFAPSWNAARDLLNAIEKDGLAFDADTFHTAMAIGLKFRKPEIVLSYFIKMKKSGLKPTLVTFQLAIESCRQRKTMNKAPLLYEEMLSQKIAPSLNIAGNLFEILSNLQEHQKVILLFQDCLRRRLRLGRRMYQHVVRSFVALNKPQDAVMVMEEMEDHGFAPDFSCLNSVWNACKSNGLTAAARKLEEKIYLLGKAPVTESEERPPGSDVLDLPHVSNYKFQESPFSDIELDTASPTPKIEPPVPEKSVDGLDLVHNEIEMYGNKGDWVSAIKTLMTVMSDSSLVPNEETFAKVCQACVDSKKWTEAMQVLSESIHILKSEVPFSNCNFNLNISTIHTSLTEAAVLCALHSIVTTSKDPLCSKKDQIALSIQCKDDSQSSRAQYVFSEILSPPLRFESQANNRLEISSEDLLNWSQTRKKNGAGSMSAALLKKKILKLK